MLPQVALFCLVGFSVFFPTRALGAVTQLAEEPAVTPALELSATVIVEEPHISPDILKDGVTKLVSVEVEGGSEEATLSTSVASGEQQSASESYEGISSGGAAGEARAEGAHIPLNEGLQGFTE